MAAVDQIFQKAVDLHSRGEFQQAGKLYKKILKSYPQHPDVLHLLGLADYQRGRYKSAIESFERAIAVNPGNPDFYNDCGESWRALHDNDAAIRCYEKALELNPDFAEAHNNLGNALSDLGQYDDAMAHYNRAIKLKNDYTEAHYNLANVLRKTGQLESAIESYKNALQLNPGIIEVHNNIGTAYREIGQPGKAEHHFRSALQLQHDNITACMNLGLLFLEGGQPEAAIFQFDKVLSIQPENSEAHYNLACACYSMQRLQSAAEHFRRTLSLQPGNATTHNRLGIVLAEQGNTSEAIKHYKLALELKPEFPEAYHNLASAYQDAGDFDQAVDCYKQALVLKPDYVEVYRHLVLLSDDFLSNESIRCLEGMLDKHGISEKDAMSLYFTLGDIHNRNKNYDKAFNNYEKANSIKRKTVSFDINEHQDYVDRLIKSFDKNYFDKLTASVSQSELPLFIIGMPRSGTTLVEQILTSHPEIYGAGELDNFLHIEQSIAKQLNTSISYPECMKLLDDKTAETIIDDYLNCLKTYSSDARYITDKLPGNFLRLGLVKTLFPKARIIHCQRDPLDTCLSIYCNYFTGSHNYAYDLEELGNYYREYERLMSHWQELFKTHIINVHYEDLVKNQEQTTREILDFLGLPWDGACLDFYRNRRTVQTASNVDVRQPIYDYSINRWKNYENYLVPLGILLKHNSDR